METRSSAWAFHAATSYVGRAHEASTAVIPNDEVQLPEVALPGSLGTAIDRRASCRKFCPDPLAIGDLGAILQAGYGIVGPASIDGFDYDHRPVPSAGARYPLRLHVLARGVDLLDAGTYLYSPSDRMLRPTGARPDDTAVATLFLGQTYVATANAIIVIVADVGETLDRYADRGYRYVLFEAGHVAQNIALCAALSGVGALEIGGFLDEDLAVALGLEGAWRVPLYAVAVGYPATDNPAIMRSIG